MQLTDNYRIYLDYIILQLHGVWHLAVIGMLLIMQAISNPGSEDHQDRAWQSVVPLVSQLKQYYDFSISLGNLIVFVHLSQVMARAGSGEYCAFDRCD